MSIGCLSPGYLKWDPGPAASHAGSLLEKQSLWLRPTLAEQNLCFKNLSLNMGRSRVKYEI